MQFTQVTSSKIAHCFRQHQWPLTKQWQNILQDHNWTPAILTDPQKDHKTLRLTNKPICVPLKPPRSRCTTATGWLFLFLFLAGRAAAVAAQNKCLPCGQRHGSCTQQIHLYLNMQHNMAAVFAFSGSNINLLWFSAPLIPRKCSVLHSPRPAYYTRLYIWLCTNWKTKCASALDNTTEERLAVRRDRTASTDTFPGHSRVRCSVFCLTGRTELIPGRWTLPASNSQ